ncbi:class I SAM-dependent RNA methyltransferase [Actinophytocola sp.]|uniref:class I SAM-dependent RNA methyltransferase n=1 Tax=Actinophytocola sp. TaxID=1872138 RepID=UPI003D6AF85D
MSWAGRRFTVVVGPIAHGGHCVARHEGRVVFVRHALPGEEVVVSVTEDRGGSFCRADAISVLSASSDRVTPPCPVARPGGCGGCDFQHAAPARQRSLKAAVVAEQMSRLAGETVDVAVEELPGGPLGWRTRARLAVSPEGRPGFRAHRSHEVIPIDGCPIAAPGTVDQVVGRVWPPNSSVSVAVDASAVTHIGPSTAVETAARREWRVPADGFWQAHPDAADAYAEVVASWASLEPGDAAWDLYCGVGLFAAVLAEAVGGAGEIIAVESARSTALAAADNLADLPQVRVFEGRVEAVLKAGVGREPSVVVLDPPRTGAGRKVVEAIAARAPAQVIYVACDPAALARDVATFKTHGYALSRLRAFDAFPMTHHLECIALLSRHQAG